MKKTISLFLAFLMFFSLTVPTFGQSMFSENVLQTNLQEINPSEIFNNLTIEQQKVFLKIMYTEFLDGNRELLEYHEKHVGKISEEIKEEVNKERCMTKQKRSASAGSIAQQLNALNLPQAVHYTLVAFAGALGMPVGNIIDVVAAVGVVAVFAIYWDQVAPKLPAIQRIFMLQFVYMGSQITTAFNYISAKAQGLPTESEFSRYDSHYNKHSDGFRFMPGGPGKKPSKKEWWKMAEKFLKEKGNHIKEGISKVNPDRIVKFNQKTLELIVYDKATKLIRTYYIPYDEFLVKGQMKIESVIKIAEQHFNSLIK